LWSYKDTHTQRNCIRGICVCESRAVRLCACGREFNFLVHEKQRKSFKSYTQMCMAIVVSVGGDPLKPRILQIVHFHCLKFRQTTMGTHTLKATKWVCLCALAFTFYFVFFLLPTFEMFKFPTIFRFLIEHLLLFTIILLLRYRHICIWL